MNAHNFRQKSLTITLTFFVALMLIFVFSPAIAQTEKAAEGTGQSLPKSVEAPKSVDDRDLELRLQRIFETSGWVPELKVEVREGLVFLSGRIHSEAKKTWVLKIIEQTKGVVAVIDNIEDSRSRAVLSPVQEEVGSIIDKAERMTPYVLSALIILVLFGFLSYYGARLSRRIVDTKTRNVLLSSSVGNVVALVIIVLGLYFALRSSGLSTLAVTVLGGSSFVGIGIGLAMKSVFENYSASLMISMREIFRQGEWVRIDDVEGIVHSVTTRGTSLMDFDGTVITIPNSKVTDATIRNYTRNPAMRTDFVVGVDIGNSIEAVRKAALEALKGVEGVQQEPAPMVLVADLAPTTIKIRVYFWFNAVKHGRAGIRSAAIQCVLRGLKDAGIELEADSREITFKNPLALGRAHTIDEKAQANDRAPGDRRNSPSVSAQAPAEAPPATPSEIGNIKKQAAATAPPEKGENILET